MAKIEKDTTETIRLWAKDLPTLLRDVADFLQTPKAPRALWNVEITPNQGGSCTVGGQQPSDYAFDDDTRWLAFLTHFKAN